jgi:mRNA interferase MazF
VVIGQGDIAWADLGPRKGSGPAFRRPVLVVQGDGFNRSRIRTVVCVALTSNLLLRAAPGNVLLRARTTGLPKDSVVNVSQIVTLDRSSLSAPVGRTSRAVLQTVFAGIDVVLGR